LSQKTTNGGDLRMISPRFAVCRDIYLKPFRSNFRLIDHFSKKVEKE
jgi:hypothetical protein